MIFTAEEKEKTREESILSL